MNSPPIAHVRIAADGAVVEHALDEHLNEVSIFARDFAARFNSATWAAYAGLWHDLGKYRPGFQRYIRQNHDPDAHIEGRVVDRLKTHSAAGALWAEQHLTAALGPQGRIAARVLGYVIAGHHAGLDNWTLTELRGLGLQPQVHEAVGVPPARLGEIEGLMPLGRVHNIVAVIEGSDPSGQLVLSAHYDSVPAGPGANDDGAGVATILEIARALRAEGERPRNDIVLLLTDGEEVGLLGAEAFTNSHPLAAERGLVLNHEARGSTGTVLMFRSTPGTAALLRTFAGVAPHPTADSTTTTLFEYLPNDTDFTAFWPAGFTALDFAYAGGSAYYHSALDSPPHVDRRSLQQMGDNSLAMTRALAAADLDELTTARDDAIYFNVPPGMLVTFPSAGAVPLAIVSAVLTLAAIVLARRRREITLPRLLLAVVAVPALLAASVGVAIGYWWALTSLRPEFLLLLTGTPYDPLWFQFGAAAAVIAVTGLWFAVVRWLGTWALWLAGLLTLTLLGLAAVAVSLQLAPILMPAPFAALGALIALRIRDRDDPLRLGVLTAGLIPTAVFLLAAAWISFDAGLQSGLYSALPLMALSFVLMIPLVAGGGSGRRVLAPPAIAVVAVVAVTAAGLAVNPVDREHPVPTMLTYTLDADSGRASWAVPAIAERPVPPDAWAAGYVEDEITDNPAVETYWPRARVGSAEPARLAPPQLRVVSDETSGDERTLRLALSSPRGAESLALAIDDEPGRVTAISAEGREVAPVPAEDGTVGIQMYAPDGPIEVEVRFATAGGPLTVRVADVDALPAALADLPGYTPPPPDRYLAYSRLTVVTHHTL